MIGWTLGRYFSARFLTLIMAVFLTVCGMIFVVDFVEMLRRTNDMVGASTRSVAVLSLLRAPSASEQLMPFCVLCGAMAAFLDLTRKLELLVARAVGVSVWGFLVPPVAIAIIIGVGSVTLFNPVSAMMKQRADRIETQIFGRVTQADPESGIWLRQKGVDGEAIIKAKSASRDGSHIASVTAYVYDRRGKFEAEVEARRGELQPGVWRLENARIFMPGEEIQEVSAYLLATNLTPEQVAKGPVAPDSVPFWDLQAMRRETDRAGLDSTGFKLQFQSLLARPLLFVAMVLIAAAFSLRFFRFGGIGKMVGGGVATGFVLYVATKLVGDLGGAGLLSAPVAAWSPAIVASMLGALALLNQEDG
ncbi:Permease YjgP/YjgQ family protein [Methylocella tundrae]|uniref:Permease YjgP/YjgQ family protein n=1 Tax=Methylocella tundrae TaxID=227605 RepID=A0A4U8Z641_METTU|nr:LPS export ABC transporter permease LptG [Methylocella tundrae]WPP04383.1 LPS export ABC transporter permease LptG [Methylocella tundrae]VFU10733.1 Permease YjgP/YjgQ family protein [Methylocella tundrae]VTZ49659.1 Permease YjgP/YjgQ family protein [Methylocella tundrae]